MSDLALIRTLAQTLARARTRPAPAPLYVKLEAAARTHFRGIRLTPQEAATLALECAQEIYPQPRYGYVLAALLEVLARRQAEPRIQTIAEATLAHALNVCGEFSAAYECATASARRLKRRGKDSHFVRAQLQAAFAQAYLGNIPAARTALDAGTDEDSPENIAARTRVLGRIAFQEGRYLDAVELANRAGAAWLAMGRETEAMLALRDSAEALVRVDTKRARAALEQAQAYFRRMQAPLEQARCEYVLALVLYWESQYNLAARRVRAARRGFVQTGAEILAGWCDLLLSMIDQKQGRYRAAVTRLEQTRGILLRSLALADASSVELNLGWILIDLYRYDAAVEYLQNAAARAREFQQQTKYALCLVNLGWARTKQGRFPEALAFFALARAEYQALGQQTLLAKYCDMNEGLVLFQLGQFAAARELLWQARPRLAGPTLRSELAECELYLAGVQEGLGKPQAAYRALHHARELFRAADQKGWEAECERQLARMEIRRGNLTRARELVEASRRVFVGTFQPIEVALSDVVAAELELARHRTARAARLLGKALAQFGTALPDLAWRAEYGLGRVAAADGEPGRALAHYLQAIQQIAALRGALASESWSNSFFGARAAVYRDALTLARKLGDAPAQLTIVEAAKARLLADALARRDWRTLSGRKGERANSLVRAGELQAKIEALEQRVASEPPGSKKLSQGQKEKQFQATLTELQETRAKYDRAVASSRTRTQGLEGNPTLAPFRADEFRDKANRRWGRHWAALDYYYGERGLMVVTIEPDGIRAEPVRLSQSQRFLLEMYCDPRAETREMRYRGTLRGTPIPTHTEHELAELAQCLIPPRIRARDDEPTLLLAAHGQLHHLPFHALRDERGYLIERFGFLYTPSLQIWAQLTETRRKQNGQMLVYGLDTFPELPHLSYVRDEVRALRALAPQDTTVQWGKAAQRAHLLDQNRSGQLREFEILHFATHALVDAKSPLATRIVLADRALTVADILNLSCRARLVTLSACATVVGEGGVGDEWIALARAFFYAGAQAVLATQWEVEDDPATTTLMREFYRELKRGAPISDALRVAQLALRRETPLPYLWAAYSVQGNG